MHPPHRAAHALIALAIAVLSAASPSAFAQDKGGAPVSFVDSALEEAIRDNLGIFSEPLTTDDTESLTQLIAEGYGITNLSGIGQCSNLQSIYLGGNEIANASPLANISTLRRIELSFNETLDTASLGGMPLLEALSLTSVGLNNLGFLTTLPGITELVANGNNLSSLAGIEACPNLSYLDASDNPLGNISALFNLSGLNSLYLNNTNVAGLSDLINLTDLQRLQIENADINEDVDLSAFVSLVDLSLRGNNIDTVGGLNLAQLETLDLSSNIIQNITGLVLLPSLTVLDLSDNEISDISSLGTMPALETFLLDQNPLSDISTLSTMTTLRDISLGNTDVFNLAPLLQNGGLGTGDVLYVVGTTLDEISCGTVIPTLLNAGMSISYGEACFPISSSNVYVNPAAAGVPTQQGTALNPFGDIATALEWTSGYATAANPVTIFLTPGNYEDTLVMVPHVRIAGGGEGEVFITPTAEQIQEADGVVVEAADGSVLENIHIILPLDAPTGTKVVSVVDVEATLRHVDIMGSQVPSSIGVFVRGEGSSGSLIKDCRIRSVGIGIDIAFSAARFAFNDFENINGEAAVKVSEATGSRPLLGNLGNLVETGSNTFTSVSTTFVKSDHPRDTSAHANFWDNIPEVAIVQQFLEGAVNVNKPLFTLEVNEDKGLFAASVFATVLGDGNEPVSGASLSLVPTKALLPESPTPGIYTATINPGRYTFRVIAESYSEHVEILDVHSGIFPATIYLGESNIEGEPDLIHTSDTNRDHSLVLSELLRVVQLFNSTSFSCGFEEDGFRLGPSGGTDCTPHAADYAGGNPNWRITLAELLRIVQFYSYGGYHLCMESEDGFCPGQL